VEGFTVRRVLRRIFFARMGRRTAGVSETHPYRPLFVDAQGEAAMTKATSMRVRATLCEVAGILC
jgi:hypothetical protein